MAIVNDRANSSYACECRFDGIVHRCCEVQLGSGYTRERGQYHKGYSLRGYAKLEGQVLRLWCTTSSGRKTVGREGFIFLQDSDPLLSIHPPHTYLNPIYSILHHHTCTYLVFSLSVLNTNLNDRQGLDQSYELGCQQSLG